MAGFGLILFLELFSEQVYRVPVLLSVFVVTLLALVTARIPKTGLAVRCGSALAAVLLLLLFRRNILDGAALYWNDAADILGSRAGIYLNRYDTTAITSGNSSRIMFLIVPGIMAAVLGLIILKYRWCILTLLCAALYPALLLLTEGVPDHKVCFLFYLGLLLKLNFMLTHSTKSDGRAQNSRAFWEGGILALGVMLVAGLLAAQILPEADYSSMEIVAKAKEEVHTGIENLRYKKGEINSLPNGRLKECAAWTASDDTALRVTMENPDSLYLRGFVGSTYNGSEWKSISTGDAYKQKNLFYWLHQDGFYAETQLAQAGNLVGDDTLSGKISALTVENQKADSRYLYTPYELAEIPEGYDGETPLTDSTLGAKGLFGQRDYTLRTDRNLVGNFTTLGARVYQTLASGEGTDYRDAESYYNTFVYGQDTDLPASLETLFRAELGDGGNREQGHTDYYTAITRIRAYLEKNMTYSTASDPDTKDGDFVEHFLTDTKIGHSVHYASAAALMFRYYGIPSRYVEGYLVTPEDVRDKKSGDNIEIPGKNGHAWTEIYIDGLGWVPVEMTPEYYNVMKEADLKTGLEAQGAKAAAIPETEEEPPMEENIQTHWSLRLALFGIEKFLILLLSVFDIFCLIFILTVWILRFRAGQIRKRRFQSGDDRSAVRAMAGYAELLYRHGPKLYSQKTRETYQKISVIGQRAAFSPHPVSGEERRETAACIRTMQKELKAATGWYEKWIMKYIERLY